MKSTRTKALEIPTKVKRAVAKRDSEDGYPCCLWCGKPAPTDNLTGFSNAHFIPRSQGGLGIEENILTLCFDCHNKFDHTYEREDMKNIFRGYLREAYPDWDESKLVYRKEQGYEYRENDR